MAYITSAFTILGVMDKLTDGFWGRVMSLVAYRGYAGLLASKFGLGFGELGGYVSFCLGWIEETSSHLAAS